MRPTTPRPERRKIRRHYPRPSDVFAFSRRKNVSSSRRLRKFAQECPCSGGTRRARSRLHELLCIRRAGAESDGPLLFKKNASSRGISSAIVAARFPTSHRRKFHLAGSAVIVRCAQD